MLNSGVYRPFHTRAATQFDQHDQPGPEYKLKRVKAGLDLVLILVPELPHNNEVKRIVQ